MERFIRSDQYNFIKFQAQILVNGYASVNDRQVLDTLKNAAMDRIDAMFEEADESRKSMLMAISEVTDRESAEQYTAGLIPFVIPFTELSEDALRRLFPKTKKLKLPNMKEIDWASLTYLGWYDSGSGRKYIVMPVNGRLAGIQGQFTISSKKGICSICNKHSEVGMFIASTKKGADGTFTKKGNYICADSLACNRNITDRERVFEFIELTRMKK